MTVQALVERVRYNIIVFISVMNLGYLKILRSVPNIACLPYFQGKV